ncbi:hypothetical protein ACOME3_007317 [Neoechinorhynchus agilis]
MPKRKKFKDISVDIEHTVMPFICSLRGNFVYACFQEATMPYGLHENQMIIGAKLTTLRDFSCDELESAENEAHLRGVDGIISQAYTDAQGFKFIGILAFMI